MTLLLTMELPHTRKSMNSRTTETIEKGQLKTVDEKRHSKCDENIVDSELPGANQMEVRIGRVQKRQQNQTG